MNSFDRELGKERFVGAAKVQHYPGVGEKAQTVSLSHAGSRAPFQVPGREMAKAVCQRVWGSFILPSTRRGLSKTED